MTHFEKQENNKPFLCVKDLTGNVVLPVTPLKTSSNHLCALAVRKKSPLKTAREAILFNDMFAFFLSNGNVIAVSGGFGADSLYHIVGAGNTDRKGVSRPSDELCGVLAQACTKFIMGSTIAPDHNDMSGVLVAALDICSAQVAHQLKPINMGANLTEQSELLPHEDFQLDMMSLKVKLKEWKRLEPGEKVKVATQYGQYLQHASELWGKINDLKYIQLEPHQKSIYEFIREFNNIAEGLRLLRRFPRSTRVVFDWPQGPTNGDPFRIRERQWANCQLHCEIYLALYILFSNSCVHFHLFLLEERKRFFTIGCSKASCLACWDILVVLSRQDSPNHPVYTCQTRGSHGKSYPRWGLTSCLETLPSSLVQATKGPRQTQMVKSLNLALASSHHKFERRVAAASSKRQGIPHPQSPAKPVYTPPETLQEWVSNGEQTGSPANNA